MSTTHCKACRIPNNDCTSVARDPYRKWDCLEGHVPTHRQQDFSFLIIHPHAGRQGVYISISLKFGEEVIPRIKTVTDTLFLAIQHGNTKVHTLLFWKIKPSADGRTCLAKKSAHLGLMFATLKSLGEVFCPIFNSSKLCLGPALNQEKLQGHCPTSSEDKEDGNNPLTEQLAFQDVPPTALLLICRCSVSSPAPPESHPKPGDS